MSTNNKIDKSIEDALIALYEFENVIFESLRPFNELEEGTKISVSNRGDLECILRELHQVELNFARKISSHINLEKRWLNYINKIIKDHDDTVEEENARIEEHQDKLYREHMRDQEPYNDNDIEEMCDVCDCRPCKCSSRDN